MADSNKNDCLVSNLKEEFQRNNNTRKVKENEIDFYSQTQTACQISLKNQSRQNLTIQDTKNCAESCLPGFASGSLDQVMTSEYISTFYSSKIPELQEAGDLGLEINLKEQSTLDTLWSDNTSKVSDSLSSEGSSQKRLKGLKNISRKIKDLIYTRSFYSYQEVADALLEETAIPSSELNSKSGRNLLRRVYDTINVLLAAEIIENDGIKYAWKQSKLKNEELESKIKKKRRKIESKQNFFQEIVRNFLTIKELIKRNRHAKKTEFIALPFLVIATEESPDNRIQIDMNKESKELVVSCRKKIRNFKDIDLIRKLDLSVYYSDLPLEMIDLLCGFNSHN